MSHLFAHREHLATLACSSSATAACDVARRARLARCIALALVAIAAAFFMALCSVQSAYAASPDLYTWSEKVAPDYVVKWGKAKGAAKAPKKGKIVYSKLDKLGRTRKAKGTITYKMVDKALDRGKLYIPYTTKPSGWGHNRPVDIVLGDGSRCTDYFWNRSHLIADSLGGSVKKRNLITGTRMQNVGVYDENGGMAFCESLVRTYLFHHHKGSVYYSAKPVYKGSELVPRSVIVDMKSSDGSLDKRFVVYNAMRGYKINYKRGSFKKAGKTPGKLKLPSPSDGKTAYVTPSGACYHSTDLCEGLVYASKVTKTTCGAASDDDRTACSLCWK